MITFNVFARVYKIRNEIGTATAFSIDYEGKQYLVTALHVFPQPDEIEEVLLWFKTGRKRIPVKFTGKGNKEIDVVVFSPQKRVAPEYDLPLTKGGMTVSQDVFFLGFPYGMISEVHDPEWHLPYPLVKKACLSGCIDNRNGKIWLLDGINNEGFSGGPVVFQSVQTNDKKLKVMGVISGFRFSQEPLYVEDEKSADFIKSNTGIIFAPSAQHIIDIIESNPNGLEI